MTIRLSTTCQKKGRALSAPAVVVPAEALDVTCSPSIEFTEAGEYYAKLLAGWNLIPISMTFPVTVFVVRDLQGFSLGCSMNVFADYVIVDRAGLETDHVTLPHEIGHTCGLSPGRAGTTGPRPT